MKLHINTTQKITLILSSFLIVLVLLSPAVKAAEINPDSSEIGYGSTSENSASLEVNPNGTSTSSSSSSASLAHTGDSLVTVKLVGIVLATLGISYFVLLAFHSKLRIKNNLQ
jgi:hypothetical protein